MNHLPREHTNAVEVNAIFTSDGHRNWHEPMKHPYWGVTALWTTSGNNAILGSHFASYTYLMYPFIRLGKSSLLGRIGTGASFSPKVFDQQNNPKNIAIGSHVNALVNFALLYQFTGDKHLWNFGLDFTHLSNGASKFPNLGINLPYLSLGYAYRIKSLSDREIATPGYSSDWKFQLIGITSIKDINPIGSRRTPVFALNASTQRIYKVGAGLESGLDISYKPAIDSYKPVVYKEKQSLIQLGLYSAYLLTLDRLQFVLGMGFYIRDEYNPDDHTYHRIGLRYRVKDHVKLNLTLKSHWGKADFMEYGIAYEF